MKNKINTIPLSILFGVVFGNCIGVICMNWLPTIGLVVGNAVGISVGLLIGLIYEAYRKRK